MIKCINFRKAKRGFNGEQVIRGTKSNFRFKKHKKLIKINPPSRTLLISNLGQKAFNT